MHLLACSRRTVTNLDPALAWQSRLTILRDRFEMCIRQRAVVQWFPVLVPSTHTRLRGPAKGEQLPLTRQMGYRRDLGARSEYYHQEPTTPEPVTIPSEGTVTVIDPRHPLYGRTLPLINIANRQHVGRCCIVWLHDGCDQHVPLAATDRAPEPPTIFPVPLCLTSVQQLVTRWEHLMAQAVEETGDGDQGCRGQTASETGHRCPDDGYEGGDHNPAEAGVGSTDPSATASGHAQPGPCRTPAGSTGDESGDGR